MKVIVLGAGVIGVTSAYFLAKAGHEVTVVDRRPGPALETSFANGGQISVSHTEPWSNPRAPGIALKWLGRKNAPLRFSFRLDPDQWAFGLRFLINCTAAKTRENTERNLRLGLYGRALRAELNSELAIAHDLSEAGILHIFRDPDALDRALKTFAFVDQLGCKTTALDADQCVAQEPALAARRESLVGGVLCADDASGDCHAFTVGLAEACRALGVRFEFESDVRSLATERGTIRNVTTSKGTIAGEACVVALGSFSRRLVKPFGIDLPIYPAKGYSVTLPTNGHNGAPRVSITDEEHRLVYSRLGDRLRIAGTAAFAGYDTSIDRDAVGGILETALAEFPGCGDASRAEFWAGLRPLMPDGNPVIGATPVGGLFLNTGHGSLGWTLALGSAKLLADLVSGTKPDIDPAGLGLDRLG